MSRLSRNPPVIDASAGTNGASIRAGSSVLSDGTLLFLVSVGPGWRESSDGDWRSAVRAKFDEIFRTVQEKAVCFALLLHVRPDAEVSLDIVKFVNSVVKTRGDLLRGNLKGTVIVVPSATVEMIIWAAMAICPPVKPLETSVMSSEPTNVSETTEWGLPRDLQRTLCKKIVAMPWPE